MTDREARNPLRARVAAGREQYYQPTPYVNYNPNALNDAAQAVQNLLGNFYARNPQANYSPQYQTTGYQATPYQQPQTVPREAQQEAWNYLAPIATGAAAYGISQAAQNALMRSGTGMTAGNAIAPALTYYAARFVPGAMKAVNRVSKAMDWLW